MTSRASHAASSVCSMVISSMRARSSAVSGRAIKEDAETGFGHAKNEGELEPLVRIWV